MIVVSSKSSVHQSLLRPNDHHAMFRFLRDIYCHKIGYGKTPRVRAAPIPPPAMLPMENGTAEPLEGTAPAPAPAPAVSVPPLRAQGTYVNAVPIAFAPPSFGSAPAGTAGVAPRAPTGYSPSDTEIMQVNQRTSSSSAPVSDLAGNRKRRDDEITHFNQRISSSLAPGTDVVGKRKRSDDDAALTVSSRKHATHDLVGSCSAGDQVSKYRESCCSSMLLCFCTLPP